MKKHSDISDLRTQELHSFYSGGQLEAGVDEAGRGCLAGPVVAAAVILPENFTHPLLTDSKKLSAKSRYALREEIQKQALSWSVQQASNTEIDRLNILNATYLAMHRAIRELSQAPSLLLIDGNRFQPYPGIRHVCIVKGDGRFFSIAAASVLAKTYRDDLMNGLHKKHPGYQWDKNKGYPTKKHRDAIFRLGITSFHRKSFQLLNRQLKMEL